MDAGFIEGEINLEFNYSRVYSVYYTRLYYTRLPAACCS